VPEAASSLLAPLLMGQRRVFEFLVMGYPLDATHAKDFGIANMVVAPQDVSACQPCSSPIRCASIISPPRVGPEQGLSSLEASIRLETVA
jgi:enoyl-CoA hydratase/carnithine racemase